MSWNMKCFTVEILKYARNDQNVKFFEPFAADHRGIDGNLVAKSSPGLDRMESEAKKDSIIDGCAEKVFPRKTLFRLFFATLLWRFVKFKKKQGSLFLRPNYHMIWHGNFRLWH